MSKAKHNPSRCKTCGRMKRRSNPANSRYWLLIHMIAEKLRPQNQPYSTTAWHEYFKGKYLGVVETKLPSGKTMSSPHSTADLSIDEFNDYMMKVEVWAGDHDVYLEDLP